MTPYKAKIVDINPEDRKAPDVFVVPNISSRQMLRALGITAKKNRDSSLLLLPAY
jgi:hypothetical protein